MVHWNPRKRGPFDNVNPFDDNTTPSDDFWNEVIQKNAGSIFGMNPNGSGKVNPYVPPSIPGKGGGGGSFIQRLKDLAEQENQERDKYNRSDRLGSRAPKVPNPLEDLYQRLLEQMQQNGGEYSPMSYTPSYLGMTPEFMEGRAQSIADAQYNPQIEAIQNQITATQGRADRNRGELGNMYQALAGAYEADVPKVQAQYDAAQIEAVNRQKQLQDALNQNYNASQNSISTEAAAMGQQAAAAEVNQGIQNDQAFLTNLANITSEQNNANLGMLENANVEYTRQGGRLAGLEGNNRQADLMTQLEDYINEQNAGIQTLNNARGADYSKLLYDMQMQDQQLRMQESQNAQAFALQQSQAQQQAQAQQWSKMMDLAGLRMQMIEGQNQGPSISDQIAGARLGLDQQQAQFQQNQAIAEMAMKIAEEQGVSFEEAMRFVQSSLLPQA